MTGALFANDNPAPRITPEALVWQVEKRGGGGHDGGMEARVAKLETDVGEIKGILGRLEPMIADIHGRLPRIEERLTKLEAHVSHLPTFQNVIVTTLSTIAGVVGCAGLVVVLIKFAAP